MIHLDRLVTLPSGRCCWLDLECSMFWEPERGLSLNQIESAKLHGVPVATGRAEELFGGIAEVEYRAVEAQERANRENAA